MRPTTKYNNGDKMGTCTFLEERDPIILYENHPTKRRFVKRIALFKCYCGKEFTSSILNVKGGITRSCGCLRDEGIRQRGFKNKTHGLRENPLYNIWKAMIYRCEKPNTSYYYNYGGRGINVCERWHDIRNFVDDMYSTYKEGLEIDRIDNNGNYEPENCRWITKKENSNNRRDNRIVEYNGMRKTVAQWVEYTGIIEQVFSYRLNNWKLEDVFTTPYPTHGCQYKNKKIKKDNLI